MGMGCTGDVPGMGPGCAGHGQDVQGADAPSVSQSSTLSLWAISLLLEAMAIFFSIRCLLLSLDLLRLGRCCRGMLRAKVSPDFWAQLQPLPGRAGADLAGLRGHLWMKSFHPSGPILIILSGFQVSLQAAPVETSGPGQCLGLLRLDSVEIARL